MSTTSTLVDLTSETNKIVIDAVAAANRRNIAYAKSVWAIVARPFPSKDLKENVGETFERMEQVVDLTINGLEEGSKATIELAEKALHQATKAREEATAAAREIAKSGVSTLKKALETTETRLEDLSKRLDETAAA